MATQYQLFPTDSHNSTTASYRHENRPPESRGGEDNIAKWQGIFSFTTRTHASHLLLGITCSALTAGLAPVIAVLTGKVFQGFMEYTAGNWTREKLHDEELSFILLLVAIALSKWLMHCLVFMVWTSFGEMQARIARDKLFIAMLEVDSGWYDSRKDGIGALPSRLHSHICDLQLASAQPLGLTIQLIFEASLQLVQAFYYSWDLALVTLATSPLIAIALAYLGQQMQAALAKQEAVSSEGRKSTVCAIKAIETVKCFNGQSVEVGKYSRTVELAAKWHRCVARFAALEIALVALLSICMFAQGFYYGITLLRSSDKTSGDVMTTFLSAMGAFQALHNILPQMVVLEKGRMAGSSLSAVMADFVDSRDMHNGKGMSRPTACAGSIACRNLSFAYPSHPQQLALQGVTLSIPAGETVFLIGKSGSGKSTIGQLLVVLYSGLSNIYIDGISLDTLDTGWLRSNITLVEQESVLFNDTIFQNIAMSRPTGFTKGEAREAIDFAVLQAMVSDMPNGVHTMLGQHGSTISGGQRQRIALARARLRDTPILILDESTSALDYKNRSHMMDAVRSWRRGKTTIIITHDMSQIRQDDYLFLLAHGSLVEEGYRCELEEIPDSLFRSFIAGERHQTGPQSDHVGRVHQTTYSRHETSSTDLIEVPTTQQHNSLDPRVSRLGVGRQTNASCVSVIEVQVNTECYNRSPEVADASSLPTGKKNFPSQSPSQAITVANIEDRSFRGCEDSGKRYENENEHDTSHAVEVALLPRKKAVSSSKSATRITPHNCENSSYVAILATVWPHLDGPEKLLLVLGFWGATVHAAATPVFSYFLAKLLSMYSMPEDNKQEARLCLTTILGIGIIDSMHAYIFRYCLEYVAQSWVDSVRKEAFERILNQPQQFFQEKETSASQLTNYLDHNAEEMRNILSQFVPLMYIATIIVLISLVYAMFAQWHLTLVVICMTPCIVLATRIFANVSLTWQTLSNDATDIAFTIVAETYAKIKTIRILLLDAHFSKKYIAASNHALGIGLNRSIYTGIAYGASTSTNEAVMAVLYYVGTYLTTTPACVHAILLVFVMFAIAIQVVGEILEYIPQIGNAQTKASKLLRLARLPNHPPESLGYMAIAAAGDIELHDLSFSYPTRPDQTVLRDVCLSLRPGTITAIVGSSGSGKSTIINLLLRLYSSGPNDFTIDRRDVKDIDTSALRSLVVPVFQTTLLFPATVAKNISYGLATGSPYNNLASISLAAEQVGIHNFIESLPYGYDTPIGEGGLGISGGQAQRIAIARALVRQPAVLVLDEATSALDVESAAVIRKTIKKLVTDPSRPMTVIMATHNGDMIKIADKIVVLEKGRVVETGRLEELLAREGALATLLSGNTDSAKKTSWRSPFSSGTESDGPDGLI